MSHQGVHCQTGGALPDKQHAGKADLFSSLPLGQLAQTLLACPDARVDDLQEELASPGVEDEDGTIDGLGGQVALKGLVDGDTVHIGVIHKPDYLVAEELSIVLQVQCSVDWLVNRHNAGTCIWQCDKSIQHPASNLVTYRRSQNYIILSSIADGIAEETL